jgi:glutathione gamma-glutamylcysteinyltransferase
LGLFRTCVIACTRQSDLLLTTNFHRKTLGQTGTGHYSPIGGFNAKRDMVLVLDVAKFKYDSYWCALETMYNAFKPLDVVSNQSRGFTMNNHRTNLFEPHEKGEKAAVGKTFTEL